MKKLLSALLAVVLGIGLIGSPAQAAPADARIKLIHGIPGVDVDVRVAGELLLSDFKFRDEQVLDEFAGTTLPALTVNLAGTDTTVIDAGDVRLPATGNYSIIAHLDARGNPKLTVFKNDTSRIGNQNGRLIVRHTAAAPRVDVKADGKVLLKNFASGNERRTQVRAGTYSVEVVPTGKNSPVVIGPADLTVGRQETLIVYAVGSLDGGLQVITDTLDRPLPPPPPPVDPKIEKAKKAAVAAVPGSTAKRVIVLNRTKSQYKVILNQNGRKVNVFLDARFNVVKIVHK